MNPHQHTLARPVWAVLLLSAALGISSAFAATPLDAIARLKRESAACSELRSADERANCLSEASTRFAGSRPAKPDESAYILLRNALKRCEPLPDAERRDCVARMQGAGSTSGSAEGGGIYRELVTVEDGVPADAPAKAATP
jgi:hypothetical protein